MKRYWPFFVVGIICLLVALLWAQPPGRSNSAAVKPELAAASQPSKGTAAKQAEGASAKRNPVSSNNDDDPLPGSSSSLPLLAVIGFGVLAGGITSAMRTR